MTAAGGVAPAAGFVEDFVSAGAGAGVLATVN